MTGTYRANKKGFGFVVVEGEDEDYFISKENRSGALNNDTVEIAPLSVSSSGRLKEAKIIKVTERANDEVIGTVVKKHGSAMVAPDDLKLPKIKLELTDTEMPVEGMKVVVKLTGYPKNKKHPRGIITEEIGYRDEPGVDILSIVKGYKVPIKFSDKVLKEAKKVSKLPTMRDKLKRLNLTEIKMVTIDGDDTKDFDDAVSIERDGDDYILGVHIADVSHYVAEGSELDKSAQKRGTSIYLTDRVIPMLPQILSNGICSLNEGEERLALSCIMRIDKRGRIKKYKIAESVIKVTHRMTYNDVNAILDGCDRRLAVKYADMLGDFFMMQDLSLRIRRCRRRRGSVDFEFPEAKIALDGEGHAIEVKAYERGFSQMMIEDFMLSANETVAAEFFKREVPFMYRGHAKPDAEKIIELRRLLMEYGYRLGGSKGEVTPKDLQKILQRIKGKPEEGLLSTVILRSMQRAEYTTKCEGHFGLAAKYYCHFTSPIRRYPDLIVHRIIKESLHKKLKKKSKAKYSKQLDTLAQKLSDAERRADDIQRDVDKLKKAEYIGDHIGECYRGKVSGVTAWGMYVELPNTVEGMIPLRLMTDDRYNYFEQSHELIGEKFNKHYILGQEVDIIVKDVDLKMRTVDFVLADMAEKSGKPYKRGKKNGRKKPKAYRK